MNLQSNKIIKLFLLCIISNYANAQVNSNALSWSMNTAYNNYLLREVHQQYADRQTDIEKAFTSGEAMLRYRDDCINRYKSIIGEFSDKKELNAKVTGTTKLNGLRVENIIFESLPKRYVTANLYIPEGEGPFPVAVEFCGHGLSGKIGQFQVTLSQLFTANGIAVLVVDPVGQGERIQFVDKNSQTLTRGATTEHTILNMGANLLGSSVAAYEYWDNHRAIDYLVTRPDIDKDRIGVFGSSGGGTQASYMLGLDERIMVASVCSYFTQREKVLEIFGPSDGCQHIPYEGRERLEIADFVLMMAPKPVLIMSGKYDFVDYWGATVAFKELEKAYTVLGSPEKVSMFSAEAGHGMPRDKALALVSWFKRWMSGTSNIVTDVQQVTMPLQQLQCTSSGQVVTAISDNVSIPEYNVALSQGYQNQRNEFVKSNNSAITAKVNELLGLELSKSTVKAEQTGILKVRNYDMLKYQLIRVGQMPVPCVVLIPENLNRNSQVVIYLNEGGKADILSDENTILSFINQGQILLVPDLRGYGETADPISLNDAKYWNREYRNAMTSMHIGKPIMGQRVTDIMSILDFIDGDPSLSGRRVRLVANGSYGPVAIHATYLDKRIGQTEITRSIKSFEEYLTNPMQRDIYTNVLYGVLKFYDLQDLINLSGRNRVRFID